MDTNTYLIIILIILVFLFIILPFINNKNIKHHPPHHPPHHHSPSGPPPNRPPGNNNSTKTTATIKVKEVVNPNYENFNITDIISLEKQIQPLDSNYLDILPHKKDINNNNDTYDELFIFSNGPRYFSF